MRVIDPGHVYMLAHLDGERESRLEFVKREGRGYPGNVGHHEGTNIQEVLRALMDRVEYLDRQIPCAENKQIAVFLRQSIFLLERRAAQRHNRYFDLCAVGGIESLPTCRKCGHIHNEDAAMQPLSAEQGVNPMADRVEANVAALTADQERRAKERGWVNETGACECPTPAALMPPR